MMNIALCTDQKFAIPCLVCIISILENNKEDSIHIYVLEDGLNEKTKAKFRKLSDLYHCPIELLQIDKTLFDGLVVNSRYPISIYYRYLLSKMMTNEQKVLYLDSDVIVMNSLRPLYELDITDKPVAAVLDQNCDDTLILNRVRTKNTYWNSGVLLLNLDYWRKHDVFKRLFEFIAMNPEKCVYPDQDAMNILFDGNTTYAPIEFNVQEGWFHSLEKLHFSYMRWQEVERAKNAPMILHFCSDKKPWHKECRHPLRSEFLHYAYLFDFIGFKLKPRYSYSYRAVSFLIRALSWVKIKIIKT